MGPGYVPDSTFSVTLAASLSECHLWSPKNPVVIRRAIEDIDTESLGANAAPGATAALLLGEGSSAVLSGPGDPSKHFSLSRLTGSQWWGQGCDAAQRSPELQPNMLWDLWYGIRGLWVRVYEATPWAPAPRVHLHPALNPRAPPRLPPGPQTGKINCMF